MPSTKSSRGGSGKRTSASDASEAAKLLRNKKTPDNVKSVAGSDLSQRGKKSDPKRGKKSDPKKRGR
jgi:hypothetical protein